MLEMDEEHEGYERDLYNLLDDPSNFEEQERRLEELDGNESSWEWTLVRAIERLIYDLRYEDGAHLETFGELNRVLTRIEENREGKHSDPLLLLGHICKFMAAQSVAEGCMKARNQGTEFGDNELQLHVACFRTTPTEEPDAAAAVSVETAAAPSFGHHPAATEIVTGYDASSSSSNCVNTESYLYISRVDTLELAGLQSQRGNESVSCDNCHYSTKKGEYETWYETTYCYKCFINFMPICAGCADYIEGDYAFLMGKHWHPHCFVCSTCRQSLFAVKRFGDNVYDKCCMKEKRLEILQARTEPLRFEDPNSDEMSEGEGEKEEEEKEEEEEEGDKDPLGSEDSDDSDGEDLDVIGDRPTDPHKSRDDYLRSVFERFRRRCRTTGYESLRPRRTLTIDHQACTDNQATVKGEDEEESDLRDIATDETADKESEATDEDAVLCALCDLQIQGEAVLMMGKMCHPNHFCCFSCKLPIEKGLQVWSSIVICYKCLVAGRLVQFKLCAGCDKTIVYEHLYLETEYWHPACYKCNKCSKPILRYQEVNGDSFDAECFSKKNEEHPETSQSGVSIDNRTSSEGSSVVAHPLEQIDGDPSSLVAYSTSGTCRKRKAPTGNDPIPNETGENKHN